MHTVSGNQIADILHSKDITFAASFFKKKTYHQNFLKTYGVTSCLAKDAERTM